MDIKELTLKINELKQKKNAVVLAHYYQNAEVQDVADYVGDSYALSIIASKTTADIIVFCGVHFMAETAKILSPTKKVLIPVMEAGCNMANMIDEEKLAEYKKNNPNKKIICYVNSTAKVKALADCCVTSSNALSIIKHYHDNGHEMLYCPDQNLGKYAMKKYGYKFDVWHGFCCIHHNLKPSTVKEKRSMYPNALFIAHPECQLDVLEEADFIGSTKQLVEFTKNSSAEEFIIGTEMGVIHEMQKQSPNKKFYILSERLRCYDMKLATINDVFKVLNEECNEIFIEEDIIKKARVCLDKMIELS